MSLALFDVPTTAPRMRFDAVLSPCGLYRYRLSRIWGEGPLVAFFMLNPSVADATQDDPTIRRCLAYAKAWGYAGLLIGNLYGLRSPNPADVLAAQIQGLDPVGPENDAHLRRIAEEAELVVCAWGRQIPTRDRSVEVLRLLAEVGRVPHALKILGGSVPGHPLYLRGDLQPVPLMRAG